MDRPILLFDPPPAPRVGLILFVRDRAGFAASDHPLRCWSLGERYRVAPVNGRSFTLCSSRGRKRYLRVEWLHVLWRLQTEGWLWLLDEGSGAGWGLLREIAPDPLLLGGEMRTLDDPLGAAQRDQRFLKAVHDVLPKYRFEREDGPDGLVLV